MSNSGHIFLILILASIIYWTRASNLKESRCNLSPTIIDTGECQHGAALNMCNKLACLKGVGEECGVKELDRILHGKCAEGLMCCHGKCSGCINGFCNQIMCSRKNSMLQRAFNTLEDYL